MVSTLVTYARNTEHVQFGAFDGVGEHRRQEGAAHVALGLRSLVQQPVEQRPVGRAEPVPDLLDLADRLVADIGRGLLGETRRDTDAQRAGQKLQQRPAARRVERIQPALQELRRNVKEDAFPKLFDGRQPLDISG